ncbi:MAG: CDP-diacylglycerol--glycerol-3-phosphate 3-phosphatidyltransferase [Vicinamibacterales bacterium]
MNLPNTLTVTRIILVPLLVVVLLTKLRAEVLFGVPREILAAAIFGLASLTDWLDGYLARRRQQVTSIGQWMDPLADKLLITAALISLVQTDAVPAWMAAVIIGRELMMTGFRSLAQSRGLAMPASALGKWKMGAQVATILLLILGEGHLSFLFPFGVAGLWIVVVLALWSALDYYWRFNRLMASPKVADFNSAREERARRKGA